MTAVTPHHYFTISAEFKRDRYFGRINLHYLGKCVYYSTVRTPSLTKQEAVDYADSLIPFIRRSGRLLPSYT